MCLGQLYFGHEEEFKDPLPRRFVVKQESPYDFHVIDTLDMKAVSVGHWTSASANTLAKSLNRTKQPL